VPLNGTVSDALGRPVWERTSTMISTATGAATNPKHYVLKKYVGDLEFTHPERDARAERVRGKVAWIQRPRRCGGLCQVCAELEAPGHPGELRFLTTI